MSSFPFHLPPPAALSQELSDADLGYNELIDHVLRALQEDLPDGALDTTSVATIAADARTEGVFAARDEGVVAGLGVAALVFHLVLGDEVEITERVPDATHVSPGDIVMRVAGPTRGLLTAERTALNFASHLSGIATATSHWVAALEGTRARVLDTRKTLPGFRALQKYAVRCGGGVNHRFSLADLAMVKDNHVVAAGGVVPAYEAVRTTYPDLPVEVEVTDLDQLRALLAAGCTQILLDNMSNEMMAEAVAITRSSGTGASLEASGGLTLERAREVALTGVDFISVGALTHSVVVFDLGFDFLPEPGPQGS
ncbi:carboxylating nicotinate-nucleotide diphosphorylase [soil metagenome]